MAATQVLEACAARREGSNPSIRTKSNMSKNTKAQEEQYLAFLKKRLESKNYKSNVSKEEYDKTKAKYDKAKLKRRLM